MRSISAQAGVERSRGKEVSQGRKDRGKLVNAPQIVLVMLFLDSPSGAYVFSFCYVDRCVCEREREMYISLSLYQRLKEA